MKHTTLPARIAFGLVLAASALTMPACAQSGPPGGGMGGQGRPKGPPPEAIAACKGHVEGDTVELTMRDGKKIKGVCQSFDGTLVARPEGGPGRPGAPG